MNAAALMDRVFDLYKATFKTQIAFALIIGIISFMLIMTLSIVLAFGVVYVYSIAGGSYDYDNYIIMVVLLIFAIILPPYIIWMYLSASGHILISKQAFYNQPVELPFRDTFNALLRVLTSAIAQLLLTLPWLILMAVVIYFSVGDGFAFLGSLHPFYITIIGLAFTIFYVVYSNIFALSIPVAIFEKRLFLSTVTRSFELLKGYFWKILGLRLLWALIVYLFSYSTQSLIVTVIAVISMITGNLIDLGALWINTGTLQFYIALLVGILMGPMDGIMTALIYFNQKIKKEGLDIEISLERLAGTRGQGAQL